MIPCGIDKIGLYVPRYYLPLTALAEKRGQDPEKYKKGIGQEEMAIAPPDEDVVALGANAAYPLLEGEDLSSIELLLFATESAVDQSKSGGTWIHHLLGLSSSCRVIELKQACYAATAAIQLAQSFIREHPKKKVLVIASDIARYGFSTPGEPTQGAGACALLLSIYPRIATIEPEYGLYSEHVMDFWRPNYMQEGLVDGKYSMKIYLKALEASWKAYSKASSRQLQDHARFCYHLPFTKMAVKAHESLYKLAGVPVDSDTIYNDIQDGLLYGKRIGNTYTASLYISLLSLLENCATDLAHKRIGLFSYGSGCVGEFFSCVLQPGYKEWINPHYHQDILDNRECITVEQYEAFYSASLPQDGTPYTLPRHKNGLFRLRGLEEHMRKYEPTDFVKTTVQQEA